MYPKKQGPLKKQAQKLPEAEAVPEAEADIVNDANLTNSAITTRTDLQRAMQNVTPANVGQLQSSLGNRTVSRLIARQLQTAAESNWLAPAQTPSAKQHLTSPGTTIHRKVYIKNKVFSGYRTKTKTTAGNQINGGKEVSAMMGDTKGRYFDNKPEFFNYAKKETENIGYVDKESAWVRLPNELMVIGETHTATTLADIVQATGTDKFMYEFYTEAPQNNPKLAQEMEGQKTTKNESMGLAATKTRRHEAESFYPKLLRGIQGIQVAALYVSASEAEMKMLRLGILMAAEADAESAVAKFYKANTELLDTTVQVVKAEPATDIEQTPLGKDKDKLKAFLALCTAHANIHIAQEQDGATGKKEFDKHWAPASSDYNDDPEAPIMKAEKARDFSLLQHIKQAKTSNYLLFGLGELHRKRLMPLLEKEGIKHLNMANFITEQKTKYAQ